MANKLPIGEILGSPPEVGVAESGGVHRTVRRRVWRRVTPYVDRVSRSARVRQSSVACEDRLAEKSLGQKSPQKFRDSH